MNQTETECNWWSSHKSYDPIISIDLITTNKSLLWVRKGIFKGTFYEPFGFASRLRRETRLQRWTHRQKNAICWEKTQMFTDLKTFTKAEAVNATPQDLSTLLRWTGDMRVLAGPATLD